MIITYINDYPPHFPAPWTSQNQYLDIQVIPGAGLPWGPRGGSRILVRGAQRSFDPRVGEGPEPKICSK